MIHHKYNSSFKFVKEPEAFDKYSEKDFLRFCLGATMYMPGTKVFAPAILSKKYLGLTSMTLDFEDACKYEEVAEAERNSVALLNVLNDAIDHETFSYEDLPLIVFRVRSIEQFQHFASLLNKDHIRLITGFNFPKFNTVNGRYYFEILGELNVKFGEVLYGLPILEDRRVAYKESRINELIGIRQILDNYRNLVLNVRVGATDFSACFGARRDINYTIYDIMTVRDILMDILNVFTRNNDYVVSGPVWEFFKVNRGMKFSEVLPKINLKESLLNRQPIVNDAVDGLMRELILDKANGFVGKTIIHPTHINFVNGMYAVTREEHEDALQVLNTSGGVIKSKEGNKMNEIGPHRIWAERLIMRSRAYGVIENESEYLKLFGV